MKDLRDLINESITLNYNEFVKLIKNSNNSYNADIYTLNRNKPFLISDKCSKFPSLKPYIGWEIMSIQCPNKITITIIKDDNDDYPIEVELKTIKELETVFGDKMLRKIYDEF